ncbi:Charged multivesicular body protein 3 [Zancudomyces culisetae]|uniref:Charged multivesicular body protein 3 n=1 Tax=Zancudomyces culisetae TaxID=1213189 RepID=A0A1R1PZP7_ZANCU|nr:Charged multivesicular body protein 3 [Zancudomyces culisetae]|eukprot:OMH86412.1 Charged multivesicular body protein 3 [Zancudomyces culisetae]
MELQRSLALKKVSGSLQKSVHVMKVMNNLVRVPEIEMAMQEMSKEMLKAGLIDEMVNDTLEMYEDVEIDEEAEEEVEKVLLEITKGSLAQQYRYIFAAKQQNLKLNACVKCFLGVLGGIKEAKPSKEREIQKEQEEVSEEEENIDLDEMRNRLSALKG